MSLYELDDDQQELQLGFVEEAREMLDELEPSLIELETISNQSGSQCHKRVGQILFTLEFPEMIVQ